MSHFRMLATSEVGAHASRFLQTGIPQATAALQLKVHVVIFVIQLMLLPVCYWLGKRWGRKHRANVLSGKSFNDGCCSNRMAAYLVGLFTSGLFGFLAAYFGFKNGEACAVQEYRHTRSEDVQVPGGELMTATEVQVQYQPPAAVSMPKRNDDEFTESQTKPLLQV